DFHEVAHWQSYYDDESPEDLVSSLYNSPELVPAIVDSNTVSFLEMINPLSVDLSYYNPVTSKNVEFKLSFGTITPVTTTEYFPSLMMYRYRNPNYMFYDNNIICKYSYITAIENSITEQNHTGAFSELYRQREIWGKILPGNDPLNVTGEIREILGELGYSNQQLSSLPERLEESNNSVTTVLLWLIVNYNLLGALAIVIACIILFVAARSSQNIPEVALGRSIGMKLHQLLLLIITEPFLLFFLSTLSGFIIAAFLLSFLVIPATGGIGYGPPFVYDYDLLVMLAFYGLMLLVLIVSGIVVSYLTIRTNISSMLKRDVIEYQRKSDTVQYGQLSRSKRPGKVTGKILVVLSKVSSRITAFAGTNKTALVKGKISAIYFISKSNLRLFTGSLLGLIIALSLLAGCLNYLEFSKPELYIDFFEKNHYNQMTFTAETIPNGSLTADRLRDHEQYLDQKILEYQLGDFLKKTPFMTTVILNENTEFQGHESYSLLSGYQESSGESILVDCVPGSSIPSGSDEVLVIAPVNTELFINEDINVNITLGSGYYKQVYQLDLTVTAILTDKTIRNDSAIRKHFSLESYHLLFPMKHFLELAQALQDGLAESIYDVNLLESFRYDIDHQGIDRAKAVQSVENLFLLLKELSVLSFAGKTPLHGDKSIIYTFAAWIVASNIFMPQFLLISIPVFVLVIILVLYSLGAINEKRMRAIIQTKTRGFSGKFVFIALLVETLILTLIATIASAMIGIPLAILMGTSSGFMTFTNDISDYVVIINPQTLVTLFVAGITFALLTHIISIVRLSRSPVVVLEEEAGKKNGRKGKRVLRSNLDVLLLVIGTLGLLILNVFMILLREAQKNYITPEYEMGPLEVFIPLIVVLVFVAPLFFLVGCILGYQRFIPYILRVFGRISWRYDWRLLASVMRNLSSNAKLTARTGLVLTIAVSFFVALVILPLSVQSYLTDSLYFTNGSDLSVSLLNLSEEEIIEIEASLQKIAGLEMTRVIRNSYRIDAFGRSRTAVLLGIQDDFHEVAHWKSYYDDESLNKLVSTLHGTGENNSIILVTRNSRMTLELLNTTEMRLDDYQGSYMIKPVAIADYFPGMTEFWNEEYYYAVCKYSFLNNLSTVGTNTQFKLWINVLPGYDPLAVSAQVRDNLTELGYPVTGVTSLPETIAASSDTRTVKLLWLAVNFSVIGTLAVVVSTVLLYSLASISRNVREIGLGRALGMKGHQLYMMMLSEPFILFILTGIPGGILAILLLEGLLATFGESIFWGVPFVLVMDWQLIIGIYGIIMLLMVTVGMSVSVKTERSNVARLLREE
ncbi:MAG: FtsX-like permease family protein, partial [Candidatus Odinarchaeota archaeon]